MKQLILLFTFLIIGTITAFSQVPNSFKYQAVARDANSQIMANQAVGVRFSFIEDQMTGAAVYVEVHYPTTSDRGVFSLEVGNGISQVGSMNNVDWSNHDYFLRVEMDPQAGNAFQLMGISQLLSVPYAMHAATVDDKDDADADPTNEIQVLSFDQNSNMLTLTNGGQADLSSLAGGQGGNDDQTLTLNGTSLSIEDGNTIDLSVIQDGVTDADADPSNELQNLSFNPNNNQLTISDGNTITIPSGGTDADADPTNELQSITKTGNTVILSDNGGSFVDEVNDADANPSNELQSLSFNSNTNQLTISDGNTITIPSGGTDADPDPTNEIQNLGLSGTQISISDGNTIDLAPILPPGGTDDQTLNLNGTSLSIEDGNAIDLSVIQDGVNDADANPSNELQNLSFDPNTNLLTISDGNSITIPSGGTDADADPTNELQTLDQNGLNVSLSNGGGTINVADNDNDATNEIQNLSLNGTEVQISNGNTIDLAGIIPPGGTDDQTLSLSGTSLSIEDGNAIDLSSIQDGVDDADADPNNEIQNLTLNGTEVQISNGNTIDLAGIIPPGGTDDQTLSLSGTSLSIEDGNAIDLSSIQDGVDDADADPNNEIQNLTLNGTEVQISNGNTIDLAGIIPPGGTDDQTLSLSGTSLSIEDGNAIDLSAIQDGVNDADADPNNELQNLALNGTEVQISNGNAIDLAGIIPPGGTDDQTLSLSGTSLSIEDGNAIDLSAIQDGVDDADNDPVNELQFLNLTGTNLSIDQGNSVDLTIIQDGVDDADADPTNEIQTVSKTGNTVTLSDGGGSFTDEVNDADADANNEIQNLSISGNDLSISNGNSISLASVGGQWSTNPFGIHYNGGRIGFGTDNPAFPYQFEDDIFINSATAALSIGSPGVAQWQFATQNGGADLLMLSGPDETMLTTRVTFKEDGRLGLGTHNPLADFHIAGDQEVIRLDGIDPLIGFYDEGAYSGYIRKAVSPNFGLELGTPLGSDKGIDFSINGSTRMVLTQYGNVGIGQNAPNNSLVVGDNWSISYGFPAVMIGSSFGASLNVGAGDGNGLSIYQEGGWDLVYISTGINEHLNLESKGLLVGSNIGTSTSGNYPLKVSQTSTYGINLENKSQDKDWEIYVANDGDLRLYGEGIFKGEFSLVDGAYTAASDRRLKTNINLLSNVLPSILKLEPSSYKYIDNKESDSRSIGLIAQDVQKLFPELVNEISGERTGETLYAVNYAGFGVVAIKAIQEQQEVIEQQAQKIEDLETRLARLEAAVAKMK